MTSETSEAVRLPEALAQIVQRERFVALRQQIPLLYALVVTSLVGFHVATSAEYVWKLGLAAPVSLLILYRLHHWWKTRGAELPPERMASELQKTHIFAIVFGVLIVAWALRVLITGDGDQQKYAVLFASLGAFGAAYGLNALPKSATTVLLLVIAPTAGWLVISGEPPYIVLGLSLALSAFFVHRMIRAHDKAFVALIRSQHEQQLAQEALRQAQKLDAMGQLTGGVAHDFNNLLSPIIAGFDLLRLTGVARGDERAEKLIEMGLASAERARTLVQRLLSFARRQPLQLVPVDLARALRSLVGLLESTCGPRVRIELRIEDDLPPVQTDSNQLELAILNLAVNARDAMPEGGVLSIEARRAPGSDSRQGAASGDFVLLSVTDSGAGMDAETLARAVEPFFSTKGVGKGTGLGLSMVHGLMAQLGGAMNLTSEPGRGTRIELWLPRASAMPEVVQQSATQTPPGGGMVLLVDDEEMVRASTAELLRDIGYLVTEAASGEEALSIMKAGLQPNLVITDHLMPGMTGTELADAILAEDPGQRIIIASGYANIDGIAARFVSLPKPFLKGDLLKALADARAAGDARGESRRAS